MGLKFEEDGTFSKKVFDKYTTKLEHREEQGHRKSSKISDKLQFNAEDVGKTVYGKSTLTFDKQNLGQAVASQKKGSILQMRDDAYEVEKNKIISDMVAKNPKTKVNSSAVQKEVRKQLAKKYGVKDIKTDSDLKAEKVELRKRAGIETNNMQKRVRIRSEVRRRATKVVTDQGAAREKDIGTEALIKANRYTKRYRRELFHLLYTPSSDIRSYKLSKLEKKRTKLEGKNNGQIMKEFFNNVHQNEAAVMEALYGTSGMHKEAIYTRFKTRSCYSGHVKTVDSIKNFTEKNRDVILHEMQKNTNRKKYRNAVFGNGSSSLVKANRKELFMQTSILTRVKNGGKNLFAKLLTGCLLTFLTGIALMACLIMLGGLLFANILSNSSETTSWINMTDLTTDFTKKETDFVPYILDSKEPSRTDVTIDDYEWYVIDAAGNETEVESEVAILDKWNEIGQADQNKYIAFICTLHTDATLENSQYIIDDIISKMYDLSIDVEERVTETDGCGCGCQSSPPAECSCSDCSGGGGTETKYVQVTKFRINSLDDVVDELYSEYVTPEKKEQLMSFYKTYQVTRGGNASLGNPVYYHWYTGSTPPSSYNGWRFIDKGDGNGYIVEEHRGLDIPAYSGCSIYMPFDGIIQETGYDDSRGNYVILLSNEGNTRVTYMHMSYVFVGTGDEKKRAYTVGSVGSTGDSTGPHLHVNVEVKDEAGNWVYVNPLFALTEERVYKNSYGEMEDLE